MSDKKYHKNKRDLCLVTHIVTKLSWNINLINLHIFMYLYARCNSKLWNDLVMFFKNIHTLLSVILYLHINMPNVTTCYETYLDYDVFFVNFHA